MSLLSPALCHRRAQLRQCLEQLKKQVPLSSDSVRNTTLNLLRRAQLHIKVEKLRAVDSLHVCPPRTFWAGVSCVAEAAGAGRAGPAAEGPPALAAAGAAGSARAAAEGLGEDEERQSGLDHVLREIGFWQRLVSHDLWWQFIKHVDR